MARRLSLLVMILIVAGLACTLPLVELKRQNVDPLTPGKQDPPAVTALEVRPETGSPDQEFTIDVVYKTTTQTGTLSCEHPARDGTSTQTNYEVTQLGDDTLHWELRIRVDVPGAYTVECGPTAGGGVLETTFDVESQLRMARLGFDLGSGTYTPDLETVRPSMWCLFPASFPPADPNDPSLINLDSDGNLSGHCIVEENNVGLMPHDVTLRGLWNKNTGAVTFELEVHWYWPLGGTQSDQTIKGTGTLTTGTVATGTAEFTITCKDGQGDPDYEPLGCYGDYGGPYWSGFTVTGSVPWRMEFSP